MSERNPTGEFKDPPQGPLRFFRWFCRRDIQEDIEGDLRERYQEKVAQRGATRAGRFLWYQVILLFRPGIIRRFGEGSNFVMIAQNFKVSWRALKRRKIHALINIGGLALGLTACLMIALWLYDELSFDSLVPDRDRIAYVMRHQQFGDEVRTWYGQPMQLAPVLREQYGQDFERVVTATSSTTRLLSWENQKLRRSGRFVEPGFLDLFAIRLLRGSADELHDPSAIYLSSLTATEMFGDQDPIGQTLRIDNRMDVQVAGLFADLPDNSTFAGLDFVASFELLKQADNLEQRVGWGNNWFNLFVLLPRGSDIDMAAAKIKYLTRDYVPPEIRDRNQPELFLHPMKKWHLHSRFANGVNTGGRIEYVWILGIIGLFILAIACINFVNLSTARSSQRALEVGIRKTIGSNRSQLITQFMSESYIVVASAYVIALGLARSSLPLFNLVTDKQMSLPWADGYFWLASLGGVCLIASLAGIYPSFYLSSFRPISALRGARQHTGQTFTLRRVLVTFQFVISVALIIGTLVILRQIQYAKNRPIGYKQDHIISVPIRTSEVVDHYETIRQELLATGAVTHVTASDVVVAATNTTNSGFDWQGKDPQMRDEFYTLRATHGFGEMIEWEIKEGRDFSREYGTDSLAFILNETAVEYMGFDDPIGQQVRWGRNGIFHVVGVVKDMITRSPYHQIKPMIYTLHYGRFIRYLNLKLHPENSAADALDKIKSVMAQHDPANPFEYQFMDERYAKRFGNEEKVAKLAGYFAILSILISCVGLLGIAILVTEQRQKEISVRKVLGASVQNLWVLLSKEFVLLVLLATCLAVLPTHYLMGKWLDQFGLRIGLPWWIFALSGMAALFLTALTVSIQTIRAAWVNPSQALRSE